MACLVSSGLVHRAEGRPPKKTTCPSFWIRASVRAGETRERACQGSRRERGVAHPRENTNAEFERDPQPEQSRNQPEQEFREERREPSERVENLKRPAARNGWMAGRIFASNSQASPQLASARADQANSRI